MNKTKKSSRSKKKEEKKVSDNTSRTSKYIDDDTPFGDIKDDEAEQRSMRRSQKSSTMMKSRMSIKKDEFVTPDGDVDQI